MHHGRGGNCYVVVVDDVAVERVAMDCNAGEELVAGVAKVAGG